MFITIEQYVGKHADSPDWTSERASNALILLQKIEQCSQEMIAAGVQFPINPITNSHVSGESFGGFRPQSCPLGAPGSAHKEGMAVDIYDPHNEIDSWIDKHPVILVKYDLYREIPVSTPHWCHLSTRKPLSGHRTFYP